MGLWEKHAITELLYTTSFISFHRRWSKGEYDVTTSFYLRILEWTSDIVQVVQGM